MVDGDRLFVWSGEFHPFRLPSPSLWLDILQKMKASGYNAVCMYFNWSYHSAAPGVYDFTGVRDMDLVTRDGRGHRPVRAGPARPVHQRRGERAAASPAG